MILVSLFVDIKLILIRDIIANALKLSLISEIYIRTYLHTNIFRAVFLKQFFAQNFSHNNISINNN